MYNHYCIYSVNQITFKVDVISIKEDTFFNMEGDRELKGNDYT